MGAALGALPGCGRSTEQLTVINFWAMGSEGERIQTIVDQFERSHLNVKVRVQQVPWTAAYEKLVTAFAGDALPDVCQLGNTWIALFEALGALEDLTDRVGPGRQVDPQEYFPGVWASNVVDGRVYGVPWYVDTRVLFYRKDLLAKAGHAEPPQTWDQWMQTMRDVQALQPRGSYAALLPVNEFEQLVILGLQTGAAMLADGGRRSDFSAPEFRQALEFYVNIFREGLAPSLSNTHISNVWQEFERGTFAMYITGPWNVNEFRQRMSPEMNGKWTTAPMPSPNDERPGASTAGGSSLVLFKQSRHNAAAWSFVEFLSSVDQQVELCLCTSNLPARDAAWEKSGLLDDPEYAAFHAQLANVRPAPATPEWESIVTGELVKTAEDVIKGRVSVDDGLAKLDRKVDALLEKRRWMLARGGSGPEPD